MQRKDKVEGEGSYSGSKDYNQRTKKFVESGKVDAAARAAKHKSEQERHEMQKAERIGKQHAKGELALIRENFMSVTLFIRACVPHMTNGGAIVNVSMTAGTLLVLGIGKDQAINFGLASGLLLCGTALLAALVGVALSLALSLRAQTLAPADA